MVRDGDREPLDVRNVGAFAVLDAVLLRPLPVPDPSRLVRIGEAHATNAAFSNTTYATFIDVSDRMTTVEHIAASRFTYMNLTGEGRPERLLGALGMGIEEIDLVVAHQANSRILDHAAERLGIPADRIFSNIDRYGNTTAATIPTEPCCGPCPPRSADNGSAPATRSWPENDRHVLLARDPTPGPVPVLRRAAARGV